MGSWLPAGSEEGSRQRGATPVVAPRCRGVVVGSSPRRDCPRPGRHGPTEPPQAPGDASRSNVRPAAGGGPPRGRAPHYWGHANQGGSWCQRRPDPRQGWLAPLHRRLPHVRAGHLCPAALRREMLRESHL